MKQLHISKGRSARTCNHCGSGIGKTEGRVWAFAKQGREPICVRCGTKLLKNPLWLPELTKYFGVTNHCVIIPLVVVARQIYEEKATNLCRYPTGFSTRLTTRALTPIGGYPEVQHSYGFDDLWLGPDGVPFKPSVHTTEEAAVAYATKSAESKLEHLTSDIDRVSTVLNELQTRSA